MRQPDLYSAQKLKEWSNYTQIKSGEWVPLRPMGHNLRGIAWRWKMAWLVLIGRADVVTWNDEADHSEKREG